MLIRSLWEDSLYHDYKVAIVKSYADNIRPSSINTMCCDGLFQAQNCLKEIVSTSSVFKIHKKNGLCIHVSKAFECLLLLEEFSKGFSATAQGSLQKLHLACD